MDEIFHVVSKTTAKEDKPARLLPEEYKAAFPLYAKIFDSVPLSRKIVMHDNDGRSYVHTRVETIPCPLCDDVLEKFTKYGEWDCPSCGAVLKKKAKV